MSRESKKAPGLDGQLNTYSTQFGTVSMMANEAYIRQPFDDGSYWDEETLRLLQPYIDPGRNIFEVGAHCGTSTLAYCRYTRGKVYAFEPQKRQFELLRMNPEANGVRNASIYNRAVFCHNGTVTLDSLDRYERATGINHGGVSIGLAGETVSCVRVDDMDLRDIGFMHIDAQGQNLTSFIRRERCWRAIVRLCFSKTTGATTRSCMIEFARPSQTSSRRVSLTPSTTV